MSFPIISQSLLLLDSVKFLFAFIIESINPSISSVFSTSISTAYFDNKFCNASCNEFPIATLFPEATITFFNTGVSDSFSIV